MLMYMFGEGGMPGKEYGINTQIIIMSTHLQWMHRSAEPSPLHACMTRAHVDLHLAYYLSVYAGLLNIRSTELDTYYHIHIIYPAPEVLQSQCMI